MYYLGIDPGLTGALTILNSDGTLKEILDLANVPAVISSLKSLDLAVCYLESQKVFNSDLKGGKIFNVAKLIENYGFCKGLLTNFPNIIVSEVAPITWEMVFYNRRVFDVTNHKYRSVVICQELAQDDPTISRYVSLKKHHNRADSFLIAQYGFIQKAC
jgi:hypothetical protein